ncbi:MAG TPA: HDOD domain-containing protein [Polyangia bacterium]|nr:HDOD domain-containing protein [Polyangia bacterium]
MRDRAVAGTVQIPPYPSIALRLQSIVDDGNFGLADLARIVSADAVVTATVLRLANSGYYRGTARLTALPDAISRIGAQELCKVALAASLGHAVGAQGPLSGLRRSAWRQALGSALVSQVLGPLRRLGAQQSFLSGLLHDFGRMVAIASLEEVLAAHPQGTLDEATWVGIVDRLHVELGTLVSSRWNLPDLLVEVIAGHHLPPVGGTAQPFIELVCSADDVVMLLEDCPYLLRGDFARVTTLAGDREVDALMQYIPLIPGYISGLDELIASAGSQGHSAVEKPESVLGEPRLEVDFPVVWTRTGAESEYRARYVTDKGLAFVGRTAMHEGSVARLRVTVDGQPLDLSGRVVLCRPEGSGNLIEMRLFALPGAAQTWWSSLLSQGLKPA